jgi:hypothetical protein
VAKAAVALCVAAAALVPVRWAAGPGDGAASTPGEGDGLPSSQEPYRIAIVAAPLASPPGQAIRPWAQVLADLTSHNQAPRPVRVESLAQPGDDLPGAVRRFALRRSPAELVVLAPVSVGFPASAETLGPGLAHARALGAEVLVVPVPEARGSPTACAGLGAECLDTGEALAADPSSFAADGRLSREGHQVLAQRVARWLRERGVLQTDHLYADQLDLARVEDGRPELVSGFSAAEDYPAGLGGRWTGREALLRLERRADEGGLVVALSLRHPRERSGCRVEVAGRASRAVSGKNGQWNLYLDVRDVPGAVLPVRIVADDPYLPRDYGPTDDARTLGVLVHAAWLIPRPVESELDLSTAEDGRLELADGFWRRERWPDGRIGRWTRPEATLRLERQAQERGLVLDLSVEHPEGVTAGRIEAGGRVLRTFRWDNGSRREVLDIGAVPGREVPVRFVVETAFEDDTASGRRGLGLFLHSARLVDDPGSVQAASLPVPPEAAAGEGDWPGVTTDLDVASAAEDGPELRSGFGPREDWPDGRSGRWTAGRAALRLPRTAGETELVLDLSFQCPWNLTTGWVEVNGVRRHRFRGANGAQRLVIDVGEAAGQVLDVGLVVDRPFHRPEQPSNRELGLFLHRVRLARPN